MTTPAVARQTCARDTHLAAHGALCDRCWQQLQQFMADLPDLVAVLDETSLLLGTRESDESKRTKVTGSPALIRLDVMAAQSHVQGDGDGIMPVWPTMDRWAGIVARRLGINRSDADAAPFTFLNLWVHSIAADREMIPEFWRDMRDLRNMLRRITNAPKPIGRCFGWDPQHPCREPLYQPEPTPPSPGGRPPQLVLKCPACGRTYREADIVKLRIQHEQEEAG